jgi:stress-induced morphogen
MGSTAFDYAALSDAAKEALGAAYPRSAIETEQGYQGRVHIRIVSSEFNGKREADKQAMVWDVLKQALGERAQGVSLVLAYGMDELP